MDTMDFTVTAFGLPAYQLYHYFYPDYAPNELRTNTQLLAQGLPQHPDLCNPGHVVPYIQSPAQLRTFLDRIRGPLHTARAGFADAKRAFLARNQPLLHQLAYFHFRAMPFHGFGA
jgi:hypothetical protein